MRKLAVLPLLFILAACASLGIPQADTFNKQAATATTTTNAASELTFTLLQARKITPDESDRYIDRAEEAQTAIDLARSIHESNPTDAQDRLDAIIRTLQILMIDLESRR